VQKKDLDCGLVRRFDCWKGLHLIPATLCANTELRLAGELVPGNSLLRLLELSGSLALNIACVHMVAFLL